MIRRKVCQENKKGEDIYEEHEDHEAEKTGAECSSGNRNYLSLRDSHPRSALVLKLT
jgi:hypothetical protein